MSKLVSLFITRYKLPAKRNKKGNLIEPNIEVNTDMIIDNEEIKFEPHELAIKIPELAKKCKQYNTRQVKIFNSDKEKDYIYRKIIRKQR